MIDREIALDPIGPASYRQPPEQPWEDLETWKKMEREIRQRHACRYSPKTPYTKNWKPICKNLALILGHKSFKFCFLKASLVCLTRDTAVIEFENRYKLNHVRDFLHARTEARHQSCVPQDYSHWHESCASSAYSQARRRLLYKKKSYWSDKLPKQRRFHMNPPNGIDPQMISNPPYYVQGRKIQPIDVIEGWSFCLRVGRGGATFIPMLVILGYTALIACFSSGR